MTARISRHYLSDRTLDRAIRAMTSHLTAFGAIAHRYRDDAEVREAMRADEDAVSEVLGILLGEQRERSRERADDLTAQGVEPVF